MEKEFRKTKLLINKILKALGDSTLDWTIQISENSADPRGVTYACRIHVPKERVEPLTWVCGSWKELQEKLEKAGEDLNRDLVDAAYYQGEINRCDRLKDYYEKRLKELAGEDEAEPGDIES